RRPFARHYATNHMIGVRIARTPPLPSMAGVLLMALEVAPRAELPPAPPARVLFRGPEQRHAPPYTRVGQWHHRPAMRVDGGPLLAPLYAVDEASQRQPPPLVGEVVPLPQQVHMPQVFLHIGLVYPGSLLAGPSLLQLHL